MTEITISMYIKQLTKELNIESSVVGLFGNELELIALVRNCPFLYNRNLSDFKDYDKKNEAWQAIADVFGVTAGEAQARFRTLRENYNKYKSNPKCPFPYVEDMKFIAPYIIPRRRLKGSWVRSLSEHQDVSLNSDTKSNESQIYDESQDVLKFIEAVKAHPVLYNNKESQYKNAAFKMKIWKNISEELAVPVQECLNKWAHLREKYIRERRSRQMGISKKHFWFYDQLHFLKPFINQRRSRYWQYLNKNQPNKEQNSAVTSTDNAVANTIFAKANDGELNEMSLEIEEDSNGFANFQFVDCSASNSLSSPPPEASEQAPNSRQEESTTLHNKSDMPRPLQVKQELEETEPVQNVQHNVLVPSTSDEDILFGQTVSAELKHISNSRKKMKVKAEIFKLLYEAIDDC